MKRRTRYFCSFICFGLSFVSVESMALDRYCNLLWANDVKPTVAPFRLDIDGQVSLNTPITINVGGQSTAIVRAADYQPSSEPIEGHYRYWFQYPTEWQMDSSGLRYRISSTLDEALTQTPGVKTVVTPLIKNIWGAGLDECAALSSKWSFEPKSYSSFQLDIDRATAFPGVYNLQLPIKAGYEENKGSYDGPSGTGGWRDYANALKGFENIDSSGIQLEIRSACSISTRDIDISYGAINASNALAGVKKRVGVNIACSSPAQVKLELTGTDFVNGVKNKVNCGGGSCTLSFSSGRVDETLVFNREGMQTINIESLFKADSITPGEFSGNAVLKMNVL